MSTHSLILADRTFLRLSGPDSFEFLRGLVTQSLTKLTPETAVYSLLLTPQGKIIADFFLTTNGEDILLETDSSVGETLKKKLTLYKLRAKVEITDETTQWATALVWGEAEEHGAAGSVIELGPDGLTVYADPRLADLGLRVRAHREALPALLDRMNAESTSADAWHAHRIAHGVPELGQDFVSEQTFPMDVNMDLLNAIDYKKGCFVGQEVASRMKRKGEVRKRTLIATFDGAAPASGTGIMADESTIGEVLSEVSKAGLALVRLDRLDNAGGIGKTYDAGGTGVRLSRPGYLV